MNTKILYCGRHDYGTRILERTGNMAAVMRTMGHKDVKTAHPELEIVRAALDQDAAVEKTGVAGLSYGTLYGTPKTSTPLSARKDGERGRNRTYNLLIKSQLLCQLSYAPATAVRWEQTLIISSVLRRPARD